VAAPKASQAFFQVFQENLPLLGLKVFLDFQEVAHHLFLQLELKVADLPDLGLHRRPLGQIFLLHEAKQFPAPLGQFPPILPNLAAVLRSQAPENPALLTVELELSHQLAKRHGGRMRRGGGPLPVLPTQVGKGADGSYV